MRECRAPRKLLFRIQCLQEENFQPPASDALYFRAFLKMQEKLNYMISAALNVGGAFTKR